MKLQTSTLLQVTDHAEEISSLRVSARAEQADEALRRRAGCLGQFLEADGRLDVVAKDGLSRIAIAAQHRIDAFAKQRLSEFLVRFDPGLHQFPEGFGSCHHSSPFSAACAYSACKS